MDLIKQSNLNNIFNLKNIETQQQKQSNRNFQKKKIIIDDEITVHFDHENRCMYLSLFFIMLKQLSDKNILIHFFLRTT